MTPQERKVMELALEALEEFNFPPHHRSHKAITALRQAIEQAQKCNKQCGVCGENQAFTGTCGGGRDKPNALCFEGHIEQAEQVPVKQDLLYSTVAMQERHAQFVESAVATLEKAKQKALAEQAQKQEPVATSTSDLRKMLDIANHADPSRWEIGFRNIVAILYGSRHKFEIKDVVEHVRELSTSPPQRQPLTDEEIDRIWMPHTLIQASDRQRQAFARAVEAAHGIKE